MSEHLTNNDQENTNIIGTPVLDNIMKPDVAQTLKEKRLLSPESFKKDFEKVGTICIKPFISGNVENMGLENYNMILFPETHHEEQLAAIETNGVIRYITGLDEFAPEVQLMPDGEEKDAVIRNIRNIVTYLEKMLATNVINPEDPEFWNKVKLLKPNNFDFWGKISIICKNTDVHLDPVKNPHDLIKLVAIEAGGFSIVAKSYEDALNRPVSPKFYLDKEINTVSVKTDGKRVKNKARGLLETIMSTSPKKMLYLVKILDANSAGYKKSTPETILYDILDMYINGEGVQPNSIKASQSFMDTCNLDMETLKLKAIVKDASFYKIISLKPDGMIYHTKTSAMMGRNIADVVLYLKNALNDEILESILEEVEKYWNI